MGIGAMVPAGTRGLSIGKTEIKMGQKGCPATEVILDDVFVPDKYVVIDGLLAGKRLQAVLGSSRAGVAAIGTGVARGAFERALKWAQEGRQGGRPLVEHQSVQFILAEMLRNVHLGRFCYLTSALVDGKDGMLSLMQSGPARFSGMLPGWMLRTPLSRAITRSPLVTNYMNQQMLAIDTARRQRCQAHSSMAKWSATDIAMKNANLLMELAGEFGFGQEQGLEKIYRDAKLLQIYEGTNQLNMIHTWNNFIARTAD